MRPRIRKNICAHCSADGTFNKGEREILRQKFEKGTITEKELRAYSLFTVSEKSTDVTISIFGDLKKVSISDYLRYCKNLGFKIIRQ